MYNQLESTKISESNANYLNATKIFPKIPIPPQFIDIFSFNLVPRKVNISKITNISCI